MVEMLKPKFILITCKLESNPTFWKFTTCMAMELQIQFFWLDHF
jgi:hypothetical protein